MTQQQPVAQSSNMAQATKPAPTYGKSALRVSYKVPLSVRLRYTLTSIARFLRMSSKSIHFQSIEFKPLNNVYRVDSYRDYLCLLYATPKNAGLSREHWKVTEINTYKDHSTKVRHEYLIANLSDGNGGTVFLRIERRLQDSSAKAFGKAIIGGRGSGSRSQTGPTTSPPQSNTDSDSQDGAATTTVNDGRAKKFKKNAVDEVTLFDPDLPKSKEEIKSQVLVERIVFAPENQIPLAKLVVLACAINDHSKEYHFFEKNCYWFCYCAVEALKQRHLGKPMQVNGKQGSWRGLPTGHLWDEVDFEVLLGKFDTMWRSFDQRIDDLINHPDNKHLKVAKKQAEESDRRAEEEARLRQEEKKQKEEAQRRAEEERKQKEEEKKRAEESERRAEEERKQKEEAEHRAQDLERQLAELKAQLASKGNVLANT
ncbi:hypothetical protein F5887DRAFT_995156 [Amanita rubescens]|nr:hypothetical protein F5887DRAFT_995156 [Amanita rubescens]